MSPLLFKGRSRPLRSYGGARIVAVSHTPESNIGSHQHDWPNLTIHLAGACIETFDSSTVLLDRPGVVFHPASSGHSDEVLPCGLETLGILFDPAWLGRIECCPKFDRPQIWKGGRTARAARKLVAICNRADANESLILNATAALFRVAAADRPPVPSWLQSVSDVLAHHPAPTTRCVAASLGLNPAWLARRYRETMGEGLHESLRRKRVESALVALRRSRASLVEIALDAGFCDQPHMNRCFRQVLGRTPRAYRLDAETG